MKKTLLTLFTALCSVAISYGQVHEWSHAYYSGGGGSSAYKVYSAPDNSGGAYVAMNILDSVNVDPNDVTNFTIPPSGGGVSISRLDNSGSLIWERTIDRSYYQYFYLHDIQSLSDGSFYLIASIRNAPYPFDIDPGTGTYDINNNALTISHYDVNGDFIDAKVLDIETYKFEFFESDISSSDELLMSGAVYYGAHFSNVPGQDETFASDVRRVFTAKYDNNLTLDWVDYFTCEKGIPYQMNFGASVMKPNGKVVSAFAFNNSITTTNGTTFTADGEYDFVLIEYDSQGDVNQEFLLSSTQDVDEPLAMAVDANNNLALLMLLKDPGDVDLTGNYSGTSIVQNSIFAMYDDNFDLITLKSSFMGNTRPKECEFTTSGDLVVSGRLFTSFDFDLEFGGEDFYDLDAIGGWGYDVFLAKYDSQFDVLYAKNIGSSTNIGDVDDLKLNGADDIFISGELGGVSDMNFGPLVKNVDGFSTRYGFSAKYSLCNTQEYQETTTICPGESYTFPDGTTQNNITAPLTREDRFTGISSCDSLIITNIQVAPEYSITEQAEVCEGSSFTFPDGSVETITAQFVQTSSFQTVHGCDSIIETTVDVLMPDEVSEAVSICSGENFTFPDGSTQTNITAQLVYNSVLQNQNGCDSTIITTVNVNTLDQTAQSVSICSGEDYTFPDGSTQTNITTQTVYNSVLQNQNGCDSIVETTVDVLSTNEVAESATICPGESFTFPDGTTQTNITSETIYNSVLQNVNGCDSVVETTVSVHEADTDVQLAGGLLTAQQSGASYQWYDCDSGTPVQGETDQTFDYISSGSFQVEITLNGCSYMSDCIDVSVASIDQDEVLQLNLYPNPTQGTIHLKAEGGVDEIKVYSLDGKLVHSSIHQESKKIQFDVSSFANGTYMLHALIKGKMEVLKFSKL